jgi:hypothetical protein
MDIKVWGLNYMYLAQDKPMLNSCDYHNELSVPQTIQIFLVVQQLLAYQGTQHAIKVHSRVVV